jgi:hypothetical protein
MRFLKAPRKTFCEENFEGRHQGFPEANLRALGVPRRGTGRNGDAGVVAYVKSSITSRNEVFTKIIPQNSARRILREGKA